METMDAIWEIVVEMGWYWLVTIIPAGMTIFGEFQDSLSPDKRSRALMLIYHYLPPVVWMIIAMIAFAITIIIGAKKYIKNHTNDIRAIDLDNSELLVIKNNYAPVTIIKDSKMNNGITSPSNKVSQLYRETYPNIQVAGFGSEVITLKLVQKINGEAVQVGVGETLERFYIEFVNKKRAGIETEDAISIYVLISFYTIACKLINSDDKPRWWTVYDPFDENTWEAKINLEANEKPQQLFIVLRKKDDNQFYIFNRKSHKSPNWIIPELQLKKKSNYIHIQLKAKNIDAQDYWIRMDIKGKNKPLFEILPNSPLDEVLHEKNRVKK